MHPIATLFAFASAAIFALNGLLHLASPAFLTRAYRNWGFPPRFNMVAAIANLAAAAFLANPLTRIWGVVLAALILFVATTVLLKNRQYWWSLPAMAMLLALIPASLATVL